MLPEINRFYKYINKILFLSLLEIVAIVYRNIFFLVDLNLIYTVFEVKSRFCHSSPVICMQKLQHYQISPAAETAQHWHLQMALLFFFLLFRYIYNVQQHHTRCDICGLLRKHKILIHCIVYVLQTLKVFFLVSVKNVSAVRKYSLSQVNTCKIRIARKHTGNYVINVICNYL